MKKGRRDLAASAAYEPEPAAAAAARRFVRETLCSWQLADRSSRLVDDAVLLTSELVTNAIVHAGTPLQVSCRLDGGEVEVAVSDRHPARGLGEMAAGAADDAERTSGRGLLLPAALASSWGVSYARTAKTVWFRMPVTDRAAAGQDPGLGWVTGTAGTFGHTVPRVDFAAAGAAPWPAGADELSAIGQLSYDELLRHTVEAARDTAGADAAYALVADEDGELRIRAGAGGGSPELLASLASSAAGLSLLPRREIDGGGRLPALYDDVARLPAAVASATADRAAQSLVTVPFLVEGRLTGVLAAAAAEPDRFTQADADRLQQVADRVALSLERARLAELERARRGRISFLAEASDLLAGTLDEAKTIALAAQLVVPRLATWCAVYLSADRPDGGGWAEAAGGGGADVTRPAYVWHCDEALADALGALLATVPPPPVPSRPVARRWFLPELPATLAAPPGAGAFVSDAVWCCPLVARGRVLGAFVIGRPGGDRFPRESVEMVEDLSRRAALALDNARLYSQQLQTSRALQRSLLPPEVPQVPGVDLAVAYAAAGEGNEVGGDFYDVFAVADGRWRFAIGDVCGTGPEAAAVTGLARYTMRILAKEGRGVAAVLDRLNRLILDEGPRARFITLIHGEIVTARAGAADRDGCAAGEAVPDGESGGAAPAGRVAEVSLVCAGHPLPLLARAGCSPQPATGPQPLLGVLDDVAFDATTIDLAPGDVLLCVTDGVTERRCGGHLLDDGDGLREVFAECAGLNAGAVAARIMRVVYDFAPQPPADDTALIVMRAL